MVTSAPASALATSKVTKAIWPNNRDQIDTRLTQAADQRGPHLKGLSSRSGQGGDKHLVADEPNRLLRIETQFDVGAENGGDAAIDSLQDLGEWRDSRNALTHPQPVPFRQIRRIGVILRL